MNSCMCIQGKDFISLYALFLRNLFFWNPKEALFEVIFSLFYYRHVEEEDHDFQQFMQDLMVTSSTFMASSAYEPSAASTSRGRRRGSSASIWSSSKSASHARAQSETNLNHVGLRQRRNTYVIGEFSKSSTVPQI